MVKNEKTKKRCQCPYCDITESESPPFCEGTEANLKFCSKCGSVIKRDAQKCPECGADLKKPVKKG